MSPSCMIGLSNELRIATNPEYMSYMCGHRSEKQAQGIMSKKSRTGIAKLFQQGILTKKIMTIKR